MASIKASAGSDRNRKANRLAAKREMLLHELHDLQAKIASLTPVKYCRKLLTQGDVSSEWFVQRLIDSGYSAADAMKEFNLVRHSPEGEHVEQLKDGSILPNALPWMKPVMQAKRFREVKPEMKREIPKNISCACEQLPKITSNGSH